MKIMMMRPIMSNYLEIQINDEMKDGHKVLPDAGTLR